MEHEKQDKYCIEWGMYQKISLIKLIFKCSYSAPRRHTVTSHILNKLNFPPNDSRKKLFVQRAKMLSKASSSADSRTSMTRLCFLLPLFAFVLKDYLKQYHHIKVRLKGFEKVNIQFCLQCRAAFNSKLNRWNNHMLLAVVFITF